MKQKLKSILSIVLYLLSHQVFSQNLTINGNFSSGNTGFTSALPLNCTCSANSYCVGTQLTSKCSSWSGVNFTDHTSGTGNFLIVDGSTSASSIVWKQAVTNILPNTNYRFSFWARSIYSQVTYPFNIEFMIGTTAPTNVIAATATPIQYGTWTKYSTVWYSGPNTGTMQIGLRQQSAGAYRDFGIDDISFEPHPILYDNLPPAGSAQATFGPSGNRWDKCNITYYFQNGTADIADWHEKSAVIAAFNMWQAQTDLKFTEVSSAAAADIVLLWATGDHGDGSPFEGPGGILAHAYYPTIGDIHFDDAETWVDANLSPEAATKDLVTVAAHEIGHALGLAHSTSSNALMYPNYNGSHRYLDQDDINGIRSIYPYQISGPASLCSGSASYSYLNTAASTTTWTATGGLQILSGQGTSTVSVQKVGTAPSGQLCATTNNSCTRCITVSTGIPGDPILDSITYHQPISRFYFSPGAGGTSFEYATDGSAWSTGVVGQATFIVKDGRSYNGYVRSKNACGTGATDTWFIIGPAPMRKSLSPETETAKQTHAGVFPNPVSEKLTIEIKSTEATTGIISLYDVTGKQVLAATKHLAAGIDQASIDVSHLTNGTYFLNIQHGTTIQKELVIVNH